MKIKVCDSMMGSGKTQAAINKMNRDTDSPYIFITPYLAEVDRVIENCKERRFCSPYNLGKGKLESLHELLKNKRCVGSTHALFKTYNETTAKLIKENGYKLVLDEVFNVIEQVPISKWDLDDLIGTEKIKIEDENVKWLDPCYNGVFSEIKQMAENQTLILYEDTLLLWLFPVDIFKAFSETTILTYMFESQFQKYYYDMNDIEMEYIGVVPIKGTEYEYEFSPTPVVPESAKLLKDKIHIVYDKKLNAIGEYKSALSSSWYQRHTVGSKQDKQTALRKNTLNVFRNRFQTPANKNLWTTFKTYRKYISGGGYTRGFAPQNIRATNEYRHKTHLAYCVNVFFNPFFKKYFISKGVSVKEDEYALSEMVQWIWRSAIRDGEDIWIYIPSRRMRELLENWLEELTNS